MISKDKQYRTRDGREVRIYAVDGGDDHPVHGAIKRKDGTWISTSWSRFGSNFICEVNNEDLIEYDPKSELLEEAKRRYPVGTKVYLISCNVGGNFDNEVRWTKYNYHRDVNQFYVDGNLLLYDNGIWAEIVPELTISERLERIENKLNIK